MLLKNKKALVTGGSKGIGKAIVETFLENGAVVYVISRTRDNFQSLEELAQLYDTKVIHHQTDVSDYEGVTTLVKEIIKDSSGLDIVVNNAGIVHDGLIARMSNDTWDEVIKINLTSAFYVCRAVSMHLLSRRGGSVINMSSVVGLHGNIGQTNYAASKAGLIGLTKSLAQELAPRGVRVNAICPGFIMTEMTKDLSDDQMQKFFSRIPLARPGTVKEIANVALFLASDLSTYITGQALSADGGMGM